MTGRLGIFTHFCTERTCGGIVLEDRGRVKKIQKVSITLQDGKIITFDNNEKAQTWAKNHKITLTLI